MGLFGSWDDNSSDVKVTETNFDYDTMNLAASGDGIVAAGDLQMSDHQAIEAAFDYSRANYENLIDTVESALRGTLDNNVRLQDYAADSANAGILAAQAATGTQIPLNYNTLLMAAGGLLLAIVFIRKLK